MIERFGRLETFGTQLKLRPYDRANGARRREKGRRCGETQLKLRPYDRSNGARRREKGRRCGETQLKLRPYDRVEYASSRGKNISETARDKRAAFVRAAKGVAV